MRTPTFIAATAALLALPTLAEMMDVPEAVRPPPGHKMSLHTVGVGEITYECRVKTGSSDAYDWAFVAPVATLSDVNKQAVGKYYAGPTWEANDGSKVSGKQVAVAPASAGSIPLQLVKAEPASGTGTMNGVTYIQRLNTKGGVAPTDACSASSAGARKQVSYQADYVFYKM